MANEIPGSLGSPKSVENPPSFSPKTEKHEKAVTKTAAEHLPKTHEGEKGGVIRTSVRAGGLLPGEKTPQPLLLDELVKKSLDELKQLQAELKSTREFFEKIPPSESLSLRTSDKEKPPIVSEETAPATIIAHLIVIKEAAKHPDQVLKKSPEELEEVLKSALSLLSVNENSDVKSLCWLSLKTCFSAPAEILVPVFASALEALPLPLTRELPGHQYVDTPFLKGLKGCAEKSGSSLKAAYSINNFLQLNANLLSLDEERNVKYKNYFNEYFEKLVDRAFQRFPAEGTLPEEQLKQLYSDIPMLAKLATPDQLNRLRKAFEGLGEPGLKSSKETLKSFELAKMALSEPEGRANQLKDIMEERQSLTKKLGKFGHLLSIMLPGVHRFNREKMDRAGEVILEKLEGAFEAIKADPKKKEIDILHEEIDELKKDSTFNGILKANDRFKARFFGLIFSDLQTSIEWMNKLTENYEGDVRPTIAQVRATIENLEKYGTLKDFLQKPKTSDEIQLKDLYHKLLGRFKLEARSGPQKEAEEVLASLENLIDLKTKFSEISKLESNSPLKEIIEKTPDLLLKYQTFKMQLFRDTLSNLKLSIQPKPFGWTDTLREVKSSLESLADFKKLWASIEKGTAHTSWEKGVFHGDVEEKEFNKRLQSVSKELPSLRKEFLELTIDAPNRITKKKVTGFSYTEGAKTDAFEYVMNLNSNSELLDILAHDVSMKKYCQKAMKNFLEKNFTEICEKRHPIEKFITILDPSDRKSWETKKTEYEMRNVLSSLEIQMQNITKETEATRCRIMLQPFLKEPFASSLKKFPDLKLRYDRLNSLLVAQEKKISSKR